MFRSIFNVLILTSTLHVTCRDGHAYKAWMSRGKSDLPRTQAVIISKTKLHHRLYLRRLIRLLTHTPCNHTHCYLAWWVWCGGEQERTPPPPLHFFPKSSVLSPPHPLHTLKHAHARRRSQVVLRVCHAYAGARSAKLSSHVDPQLISQIATDSSRPTSRPSLCTLLSCFRRYFISLRGWMNDRKSRKRKSDYRVGGRALYILWCLCTSRRRLQLESLGVASSSHSDAAFCLFFQRLPENAEDSLAKLRSDLCFVFFFSHRHWQPTQEENRQMCFLTLLTKRKCSIFCRIWLK